MRIYIAEELSNSIKASDKKYFKSKAEGYDLFFSKKDKFSVKFSKSKIVFGNIPPTMIEQSSELEWIQLESTGFSEYMYLEKLDKKIIITNLKGFFAKQVAQTALASIFSFYRGIIKIDNLKNKKKWIGDPIRKSLSTLENKHVVLIYYLLKTHFAHSRSVIFHLFMVKYNNHEHRTQIRKSQHT